MNPPPSAPEAAVTPAPKRPWTKPSITIMGRLIHEVRAGTYLAGAQVEQPDGYTSINS